MENRIYIQDLHEHIGSEVTLAGWVDVRRDHGKLIFIDLRDATGKVQMVALPKNKAAHVAASAVRPEWVIKVVGEVKERPEKMVNPDLPNGDLEFVVTEMEVLAEAQSLPFDLDSDLNLDTLLDYRPLTLRRSREHAIFKVQSAIVNAYRTFLNNEGFTEFQSPKIIGADAEGSGEVFEVKYLYDRIAHLATSPQLYKQMLVGVFERVFTVGNVFRSEKHATSRHLNEYTSLDMEMGFITDHTDIMKVETNLLRSVCEHLRNTCEKEFSLCGSEIPTVPENIPSMKLREAQELIYKETGKDVREEPDLEPEDERWMCEWSKREHDSDFMFITHYPVSKRPFYTYEDEQDPGFTKSFDLLFRGVEITTGGQRRHLYESIVEGARLKNLDPENFEFYLQAFKYGMPPHGGWGMGLERLTARFLNIPNVKEATLFPRDINRIDTRLSSDEEEGSSEAPEENIKNNAS
ncbi:MAG: aspartate--tRNA(Asn) ligase [Candidatus Paceibacterota bacterium]